MDIQLGRIDLKSICTDEYEVLLQRLISARKEAGILQQDLARRLDKPQSFVSKYERRARRLDVVEFITICRALNVDSRSIVGEIEDRLSAKSHPEDQPA